VRKEKSLTEVRKLIGAMETETKNRVRDETLGLLKNYIRIKISNMMDEMVSEARKAGLSDDEILNYVSKILQKKLRSTSTLRKN